MVFFFTGASNLDGQYSSLWANRVFYTEEAGCRHGDTLAYSAKSSKLIIGSPYCHNYFNNDANEQRLAGRLYFFNHTLPFYPTMEISSQESSLFLA
jgi:hypothetical protein